MLGRAIYVGFISAILLISVSAVQAGITLNATRVIYPEGKKDATLSLTNETGEPRLIQSWVDAGEGSEAAVPFIILPPIFRVNPGKGQSLRIIFTGGNIPRDRESVFWINVLEVRPLLPGKKAGTDNYIQFPVRTRLKLFYRPKDLPGNPQEAVAQLRWRLLNNNEMECENPTAFNVSFQDVRLASPSSENEEKQSGMCPAKGRVVIIMKKKGMTNNGSLFFSTIDDNGGFHAYEASYGY